jgi:hypothetical protein
MDYFFTNVMVALGLTAGPPPAAYIPLGRSETALFEIDVNSIRYAPGKLALSVKTRMRVTLNVPVIVTGKKKLGSYYIDELTMRCEKDDMVIEEMTLYSTDGEALANGKDPVVLPNPKVAGHVVTELLARSCPAPDPKLMAKL